VNGSAQCTHSRSTFRPRIDAVTLTSPITAYPENRKLNLCSFPSSHNDGIFWLNVQLRLGLVGRGEFIGSVGLGLGLVLELIGLGLYAGLSVATVDVFKQNAKNIKSFIYY